MARNVRVRSEFRTRENGTLTTRTCDQCGKVVYAVPAGAWLHWGSLEEGCPREGTETPVGTLYGPTMAERTPSVLDSPERGLARARCAGSYRRPSWEWMACR